MPTLPATLALGAAVLLPAVPHAPAAVGASVAPASAQALQALPAAPSQTHGGAVTRYTVRPGDTVEAIARRHGTTTRAVVAANGLAGGGGIIYPGQRLVVPATRATAPTTKHRSTRALPPAATGQANSTDSGRPVRRAVARTARRHGIDPSLALAIAHQESGFQQAARSSAGAIGTMQVMPANRDWLSGMAGRRLDLTETRDNITAGVLMIDFLTRRAPTLDTAIGGYYQGLHSVTTRGPYDDTKQYVRNVRALMRRY